MQFALAILVQTPPWVFLLFGFLVWQGWQARRPRTVPVLRVLIVPAVFLVMGLATLALRHADGVAPLAAWIAAALALAPAGFAMGPRPIAVDSARRMATLPGSRLPLVRNIVVFGLQYGFAVATALHPDSHAALAITGRAVSGATAGYFVGWALAFRRHWREATSGGGDSQAPSVVA